MDFVSWVVSPAKIACQLVSGNIDGAGETAANVLMSTPGVCHTAAVVAKVCGDGDAAKELIEEGNKRMRVMANTVPMLPTEVKDMANRVLDELEDKKSPKN